MNCTSLIIKNNEIDVSLTYLLGCVKAVFQDHLYSGEGSPTDLDVLHVRVLRITREWLKYASEDHASQALQAPVWRKLTSRYVKLITFYYIRMVSAGNAGFYAGDPQRVKSIYEKVQEMNEPVEDCFLTEKLPMRFYHGIDLADEIIRANSKKKGADPDQTSLMLRLFCDALDTKIFRNQEHLEKISAKNRLLALTAHEVGPPGKTRRSTIRIESRVYENERFSANLAITQGDRFTQEDTWSGRIGPDIALFSVYDGHGGFEAANFAAGHIVRSVFEELEKATDRTPPTLANILNRVCLQTNGEILNRRIKSGTTASIALISGMHLVVAGVGDSDAVFGWIEEGEPRAELLVPPADLHSKYFRENVYLRGGEIHRGCDGELRMRGTGPNMANSLGCAGGDFSLSSQPMIAYRNLSEYERPVLILATDGVWPDVSPLEAVEIAYEYGNPAFEITRKAYSNGSTDNITAIALTF